MAHVVLIGYGYWGRNVARNLADLGCLYGVCDVSAASLREAAIAYPSTRCFTTLEEVLGDPRVEACAVCTPAETHADMALRFLRAGKDVFVEKPLALSYPDGIRMVEAAEQAGAVLMVGHLLEYHPALVQLEALMRDGAIGQVQYVYSNRLHLGRFRREENILWSFAPHDIAVIMRLVQQEPIEVIATGGAYLQPGIADVTVTNLLFENGVRGHVFVSWLHPYKEQRLVVVGSEKMAVFDELAEAGQKLIVHDKGAEWVGDVPVPRRGEGTPVDFPPVEPLRAEMGHFLECVATRRKPVTDGYSGLRVLRVLQTAQQSLQSGGARVTLAHHGSHP